MKLLKKLAILFLSPAVAFAHGEQVLALPVGQAVAIALVVVFGSLLSFKAWGRLLFFLLPLIVIFGTWFMNGSLGTEATPYFLVGLLPPVLVAAISYALFRQRSSLETLASFKKATKRGTGIALVALSILIIWYCLIIPFFTVQSAYGHPSNLAFGIVSLAQFVISTSILPPCFGKPWTVALMKAMALSIGLTLAQIFTMGCILMATFGY